MATPPSAPIIRNAPDALPNILEFCWFPPSDLGSPATITGYRITLQPGNLVYNVPGNYDEFMVSGLTNGQTYQTTIEATNDDGVTYGPPATFRDCQPGSPPPAPPTTVSSFALTTPGTAVVSWTPPAILPDSQIFWYVVTTNSTNPTDTIISTNGWAFMQSNVILSGLNSNSTYYFNVRPVNCPGYGPILSTNTVTWITPVPFSPTQLLGMQLWLDANDTTTVTLSSGTNISAWADKSGNGYNATGVNSPQYTSGQYITFNGTNQYFTLPNGALPSGNSAYSYFGIVNFTAGNRVGGIIGGGTYGTNLSVFAWRTTDTNEIRTYWWASDISTTNRFTVNTINYINSMYDGAGNRTLMLSFSSINTFTGSGTRTQTTGNNTLGVTNNTTEYLQGNIHEILVYQTNLTPFDRQKVEGYLAWKWGLQAQLPTTHPFYTARPTATSVFSPASFGNIRLWIDAQDATTVTTTGVSTITQLRDKTTNAFIFSNVSGYGYTPSSFNTSYPSFTGLGTSGNSLGSNGSFTLAQPITLFFVGKNDKTTGTFGFIYSSLSANTNSLFYNNNDRYSMYATGQVDSLSIAGTGQSNILISADYNGASSAFGQNGSIIATGINPGTGGISGLVLGQRFSLDNFAWGGKYCELLMYSGVLATQDRQTVEGYLAWKWGLQGSLPSTHPYRYNNPAFVSTVTTFSPSQLLNLGLWLDATQITGATNGQALTTWPDRSPNAFTNTGYNGPTYNSSVLNGRPVVQFNGSAVTPQYFDFGNRLNILTTPGISIFSVASYASGTNGTLISKSIYGPGGGRWFLGKDTNLLYFNVPDSITGNNYVNSYADSSTGVRMNSAVWDRANSYNYSNATLCNTVAATDTGGSSNIYSLYVGAYGNGAGSGPQITSPNLMFNGYIGETIVYQTGLTPFDRQKVEGYLAWKWGLQSNLPTSHPFANIPPQSNTTFSPATFSNLQIWYDGADPLGTGTAPANGTSITTWADKSGKTNNATAVTAATYVTDPTGNYLSFNGTSTCYNITSGAFIANQPYNVFIIERLQNVTGSQVYFYMSGTNNTNNTNLIIRYYNGTSKFNWDQYGNAITDTTVPAFTTNAAQPTRMYSVMRPTTGRAVYLNGTLTASDANTTLLSSWNGPSLGRSAIPGDASQYFYSGHMKEVLIYTGNMSTDDRQTIEGYLAWKWGLQGSLPLTHPYKFINPVINYTTSMIVPQGLLIRFDATTYSGSGQWVNTGALGTGFNATITAGQTPTKNGAGNGIVFNGSSGWTFPNIGRQTSFTISTWVKRTAVIPLYVAVVSDGTDGSSQMNMAIMGTHDVIPIANTDVRGGFFDGTAWRTGTSVTLLSTIWTNVTVTFDNTSKNLITYVNGTLVNTTTFAGLTPNTSSQVYRIGQHISTTLTYFTGEIGQVLIYNRAITATEALQNYNVMSTIYTNPSPPSLVTSGLLIRFDATTYSGSGTWTNTASTGSTYDASVFNGTPVKNTAGNGVVVTGGVEYQFTALSLQTVWTMSSWFKRTGTCPTFSAIICELFANNAINMCLGVNGLSPDNFAGGYYVGAFYNSSAIIPPLNTWVNITATYNGSAIVIYVNGVLSGSVSSSVIPQTANSGKYRINTNGQSLVGEIGQILIYNRALTATEVLQNYNATAGTFIA